MKLLLFILLPAFFALSSKPNGTWELTPEGVQNYTQAYADNLLKRIETLKSLFMGVDRKKDTKGNPVLDFGNLKLVFKGILTASTVSIKNEAKVDKVGFLNSQSKEVTRQTMVQTNDNGTTLYSLSFTPGSGEIANFTLKPLLADPENPSGTDVVDINTFKMKVDYFASLFEARITKLETILAGVERSEGQISFPALKSEGVVASARIKADTASVGTLNFGEGNWRVSLLDDGGKVGCLDSKSKTLYKF